MDATPLATGTGVWWLCAADRTVHRARRRGARAVLELPVGGTAVGSGINTHPEFGRRVAAALAEETGIPFVEAANHFEANAQRDGLVECSRDSSRRSPRTLFNVANNIRWLGSGPRCGFFEVSLPERAPGSSIMPGKVNPVMCESLMQVAARVIGNDQTITICGAAGGNFQLNIMMPVMGHTTLESIHLMANGVRAFIEFCMDGLTANEDVCEAAVEQSLSMSTSLNPLIGYEKAAKLTKEAFATGKTIRELAREQQLVSDEELQHALDPMRMTEPQI